LTRKWNIVFEGPTPGVAENFEIEFVDAKDVLGNYLGFKTTVFNELLGMINVNENYYSELTLKNITSPEKENFSDKPIVALLALDKNKLKFGLLLLITEEDTVIIGLWPSSFAQAIKEDENVLLGTLTALLRDPENWERVDVIMPAVMLYGE